MLLVLLAILVCGIFLAAGRRQGRPVNQEAGGAIGYRIRLGQSATRSRHRSNIFDVDAELHDIVAWVRPLAARQFVRFDIATQPDLLIRADAAVVRDVLADMIAAAIDSAVGGSVLLTAMRLGTRIHISISDDSPAPIRGRREADLRPAMQKIALRGGSLEVDLRAGEGTITTLRLPAAVRPDAQSDAQVANASPAPRRSDALRLG
jgi:hypothetical protein